MMGYFIMLCVCEVILRKQQWKWMVRRPEGLGEYVS